MIQIILINNNWEQVNDLSDVIRIISENIGLDFARKVEEVCDDSKEIDRLEERIYDLKSKIEDLECELIGYDDTISDLDDLHNNINKLQEYIDEMDDGSDYMNGVKTAYDMIMEK